MRRPVSHPRVSACICGSAFFLVAARNARQRTLQKRDKTPCAGTHRRCPQQIGQIRAVAGKTPCTVRTTGLRRHRPVSTSSVAEMPRYTRAQRCQQQTGPVHSAAGNDLMCRENAPLVPTADRVDPYRGRRYPMQPEGIEPGPDVVPAMSLPAGQCRSQQNKKDST